MSAAFALDAADGVIDGRSFGRPIIQAGGPQFVQAQPQYFQAQPQFVQAQPQFIQGQQFIQAQPQFVQAQPQFAQFGGFQTVAQPTYFGGASSQAAALDAADGVIDGRHFGRPIVQAGAPSFGGFTQGPTVFGGQTFGTTFAPTQFVGGASSTAAALDAADGVIDGRHFGRPIVQQGGLVPYTGGARIVQAGPSFVQQAPAFGGNYFGGQSFVGGYNGPQFGGAVPVQQYGGFPQQFGAQSRAAQLDAADGVMDGRFYGRQIVQRR